MPPHEAKEQPALLKRDWTGQVRFMREAMLYTLLTTLLIASLVVLGVKQNYVWLFGASYWLALATTLMEFVAAAAGTRFTYKAWRYFRKHRRLRSRTIVKQLRKSCFRASATLLLIWLLELGGGTTLLSTINLVPRITIVGIFFFPLILLEGQQLLFGIKIFRELAAAIEGSEQAPDISEMRA